MERVPDTNLSLIDLISRHARQRPDALAVVCGNSTLTNGELDSKTSRLAELLRNRGVSKGHRVLVLTGRCLELPVLLCAVLRTGACYVPLDQDSVSETRIAQVVKHVEPVIALVSDFAATLNCPVLSLQQVNRELNGTASLFQTGKHGPSFDKPDLEDLAYIIYTSGTTSLQKGVMVQHRALLNYVQQGNPETPFNMRVTSNDRVFSIFSPGFDGKIYCT